ncbi:MAG: hypothetical protein HDT24_10670 [Ruminococcus sp.]|nr:hypothetical protein [Ruminococcus sp.]
MDTEKAREIIFDNYMCNENSFIFLLHEKSRFSEEKFREFCDSIAVLAETEKSGSDLTMQINNSYQYLLREIIYHFDPDDLSRIDDFPANYNDYIEKVEAALVAYHRGKKAIYDDFLKLQE